MLGFSAQIVIQTTQVQQNLKILNCISVRTSASPSLHTLSCWSSVSVGDGELSSRGWLVLTDFWCVALPLPQSETTFWDSFVVDPAPKSWCSTSSAITSSLPLLISYRSMRRLKEGKGWQCFCSLTQDSFKLPRPHLSMCEQLSKRSSKSRASIHNSVKK